MRAQKVVTAAPDIRALRIQIDAWRDHKRPSDPMPAPLWHEAIELARQHGVATTSKGLRIDYGALKRRLDLASSHTVEHTAPLAQRDDSRPDRTLHGFVEFEPTSFLTMTAQTQVVPQTILELSAPSGVTLKLSLASGHGMDLAAVVTAFCGRKA